MRNRGVTTHPSFWESSRLGDAEKIGGFLRRKTSYGGDVVDFRVRALRRAIATSLFVPLVACALFFGHHAGFQLPERQWLGVLLLALSGIPTTMHLMTAAAGRPWQALERDWTGLQGWQRAMTSTVVLVCGVTAGAAVVLITLALIEVDAKATEEQAYPPPAPKSLPPPVPSPS